MSVPGYESYRDSGVEWLGEVPAHWKVRRLKHIADAFPSNVDKKTYDDETPVRLCNYTDVYYNDLIVDDPQFMAATATPEQIAKFTLRAGDTIITKDSETADDIASAAYVPADIPGVVCGYHLSMIRPHEGASGAFIKRYFDSAFAKACVAVRANGLTRVGLGQYAVDNLDIPVPPLAEQSAIAAFLDRETAKIDALVEAQRRLIELLKEKRQAVISHAVTKGLDPAVPMKDSGAEWLGEVPAHWEVRPFRYALSCIESGTSVNAVDVPARADELGVLKTSCVYSGAFAPNENKTVVAEEVGRVSCPVRGGTLIVSRMNTPDLVGAAGFVKRDVDNLFLPDRLWQLHFSGVSPAFAHYWTLTKAYRGQVQIACAGTSSSMQNLSQDQLRSFIFPFPPYPEQLEIVDRLNKATQATDRLMAKAENTITLLQERRAALISAAVTGKIDVRGLAPEQAEAA